MFRLSAFARCTLNDFPSFSPLLGEYLQVINGEAYHEGLYYTFGGNEKFVDGLRFDYRINEHTEPHDDLNFFLGSFTRHILQNITACPLTIEDGRIYLN